MLWHSIYLQVVKVHLFNYSISRVSYVHSSRTTDESLHFTVLPCHLRKCRLPVYIVIQSLKDISYDQISLQRSTRNFEIRRQVLRVKKNDEIKKKNTKKIHMHLSLYLPIRRCTPERMCMHQSLSLSFSVYICKNGLDPDQTRMELRKECFANRKICACYWKYAKPMRTIRWVFSIHWPVPCGTGVRGSRKSQK